MHGFKILFAVFFCYIFLAQALGANVVHSSSNCILPEPDGGNEDVASRANIHGKIIKKSNSTITIKESRTNKNVLIRFTKKTTLYTVYGGDEPLDVLRPGLITWVWYEHCKKSVKIIPTATMIWIYTTDPDIPMTKWENMPDYLK
jgi:hypothetical protein